MRHFRHIHSEVSLVFALIVIAAEVVLAFAIFK